MVEYIILDCGIHEAKTLMSPCPICARAAMPEKKQNKKKIALAMHEEGASYSEIARALDKSPQHARGMVHDAQGVKRPRSWMHADCVSEREKRK